MKLFVVPLPLFDKEMSVQGYWLFERSAETTLGGREDFRAMSEAFSSPGLELLEEIGTEPFAGDKPLFINLKKMQLLTGFVYRLKIMYPERLVAVLSGKLGEDDSILESCREMKEKGYQIALNRFPDGGLKSKLLNYVDYLMLDMQRDGFWERLQLVKQSLPHIKLVLTNIPDMKTFEAYANTRGGLFSGNFYSQPITVGAKPVSPVKINMLQLLSQVNDPDFELEDAAKIIQRDPALSVSLLKFINSGALGLRQKVTSINSAVAILGQTEMRRWVSVVMSVKLAEDRPGEITKLSLVRARFAENLAGHLEMGVFQSGLFMVGLFSLLDVILEKPMHLAIKEISVDPRVHDALVNHSGEFYKVLALIYAYERADWDAVSIMMIQNNMTADMVSGAYVDALVWYNQLLESIDGEEETQA